LVVYTSPALENVDETLWCLRYANRAKHIRNNAEKNVDSNTSEIVESLKSQVRSMTSEIQIVGRHVKRMAYELIIALRNKFQKMLLAQCIIPNAKLIY